MRRLNEEEKGERGGGKRGKEKKTDREGKMEDWGGGNGGGD